MRTFLKMSLHAHVPGHISVFILATQKLDKSISWEVSWYGKHVYVSINDNIQVRIWIFEDFPHSLRIHNSTTTTSSNNAANNSFYLSLGIPGCTQRNYFLSSPAQWWDYHLSQWDSVGCSRPAHWKPPHRPSPQLSAVWRSSPGCAGSWNCWPAPGWWYPPPCCLARRGNREWRMSAAVEDLKYCSRVVCSMVTAAGVIDLSASVFLFVSHDISATTGLNLTKPEGMMHLTTIITYWKSQWLAQKWHLK